MLPIPFAAAALLAGSVAPQTWQPNDPMQVVPRSPEVGAAHLNCTYLDRGVDILMHACVSDADGGVFLIFMQPGWTGSFHPGHALFGVAGVLDGLGAGMAESALPPLSALPMNYEVEFYGVYFTPDGVRVTPPDAMLLNAQPVETLDFDWTPEGGALPAGILAHELWATAGVHVSADNATPGHPDKAILFDSSAPTGGDFDLATPGYGWLNDTAYGKLVIIAENDVGLRDYGYVLDPDDEAFGGVLRFRFDQPVAIDELTIVDVDDYENVRLRGFFGPQMVVDDTWAGVSDNGRMTFGFGIETITELELRLSGSGGVAELKLMPCPVRVAYDLRTLGVPTGLQLGEVMTDQFQPELGFRVTAISNVPGTNKAVIFDTAHPTGGDTDLVTPGYHPTNTVPLGLVMVLAENDVDADHDGLIDDPGDDAKGGRLIFTFDYDVVFDSATVLDIDESQTARFELFDAAGSTIGIVPLAGLGDNSVETVRASIGGVRKIAFVLSGSGALAELTFCRDLYGVPQ